ncbi:rCG52312 [Rattus norvegicus]|uniref:RCG52312 n=1 Tax=Rattus norvegicus TaxID=10116 RepID=A6K0F3_RAT|nr:rCG52312 [Rattus norvegicus]
MPSLWIGPLIDYSSSLVGVQAIWVKHSKTWDT